MNLMQILGPAVGGPLIDILGPGYVYVVMTVIYIMSVVMLFRVRSLSPEEMAASRTRGMGAGRAGPLGGRRRGTPRGAQGRVSSTPSATVRSW